jgi:hypothetical protein
MRTLTETERQDLSAAMDRLIPPTGELPGAGSLGLAEIVEGFSARHAPFSDALLEFSESLTQSEGARFHQRPAAEQNNTLKTIENSLPAMFHVVLELVYMAYYGDPRIQRAIGYRTGPLQPRGYELPPFDESVLETVKQRMPFWREAP